MKKSLICIALVIFSLSNITFGIAEETVTVDLGEWEPLISKSYKYYGVVSRIVEEAFALEGINVEYRWVPWKRAYKEVLQGKSLASPGWSKSEEREKEVLFSESVFEKYQVFFHLKSFPFQWESYDDLKKYKIGVTRGYFYGEEFKEAVENGKIKVDVTTTDEQNFKKLVYNRFDIFPVNLITSYHIARKSLSPTELELITYHPKNLAPPSTNHVIFVKNEKGERILQLFNKGLNRLKESGKIDQYFGESERGEYTK